MDKQHRILFLSGVLSPVYMDIDHMIFYFNNLRDLPDFTCRDILTFPFHLRAQKGQVKILRRDLIFLIKHTDPRLPFCHLPLQNFLLKCMGRYLF